MDTAVLDHALPMALLAASMVYLALQMRPKQKSGLWRATPGLEELRPLRNILFGALCTGLVMIVLARAFPFSAQIRAIGALLAGSWLGFTVCQTAVGGMLRRGTLRPLPDPDAS